MEKVHLYQRLIIEIVYSIAQLKLMMNNLSRTTVRIPNPFNTINNQ